MFRRLVLILCAVAPAALAETPNLGEPLSDAQIAELDYTVMPDGDGLPAGSGDAAAGERLYQAHCFACHGREGEGGPNDRLAGGHGTIAGDAPIKTVGSYWPYATTVFDYLRRAMPYMTPGSLSADEVYALTAYLLFINGVVEKDTRVDASSLPGIEMPNAGNFFWSVPAN